MNKYILEKTEITQQLGYIEEKTSEFTVEESTLHSEIEENKKRIVVLEGHIGESFSNTTKLMYEHFELQKKEPELRCELRQVSLLYTT